MDKKTILIADNSMLNRMMIGGILADDYNIAEAEDGAAALEVLRASLPGEIACVLLDLHMPGVSGYDVLEEKLEDPAIKDIPVVVITADTITSAEARALDLGASDFLTKPIEPEIMKRRIRSVVYAREAEEQRMHIRILEEIAWHSDHDDLTGIYTRRAFLRETAEMLAADPDSRYELIVFDFEKFKLLNELFGTDAGDEMLKVVADVLRRMVSSHGVFGRLGNDYFAFCIKYFAIDVDDLVAEVSKAVSELLKSMNIDLSMVMPIGIYPIDERGVDVSVMLDRAMLAQHTVKGNYDSHIAYYNNRFSERLLEEQDILNSMEAALEAGEFRVMLQPVYDISTGAPASAEALVRWHRPGHGIVSPGVFIPLFERNGFINKLDPCIWEQVCQILAHRRDNGLLEIPISVNLSRRSMYRSDLYDTIVGLVEKYDIDPMYFRIEVTESAYFEDADRLIATVRQLQDHGFPILMDDFGAGYSTLTSLKDIPVDILKADMMFMRDFERGGRIGSIFTSIVRMARWLGIPVIAEGVETAEQVEFLRSVGCRYSQGYYFARPMPVEDFERHLEEHEPHKLSTDVLRFSPELIDEVMGSNRVLDHLADTLLDAYIVMEWNEGAPEIIRMSDGFYKLMGADQAVFAKNVIRPLDYLEHGDGMRFTEACGQAIETGELVEYSVSVRNLRGAELDLKASIMCLTAIDIDAIFFIGISRCS